MAFFQALFKTAGSVFTSAALISQQRLLAQQGLTLNAENGEAESIDCVVSLTSYGKRIATLHYTLYSLLNQTVKPQQIIVWLAHGEVLTAELKN